MTKAEHLLKLADEYQTKSVFDLCVNYLKTLQRSEHNAIQMLYLANGTIMAREDKRLDGVRSECYGLIKNMAIEKISKNEYFQNLDNVSLQNAFVEKVERLEKLVCEVHPQFIGLVEFCMSLCLNSTEYESKITRCPTHFSNNNKATMNLNFRMETCAVCRSMIQQLVSISKEKRAVGARLSSFGYSLGSNPFAEGGDHLGGDHLYGGTSHFDLKLSSVVTEFSRTYSKITPEKNPLINLFGLGGFSFSSSQKKKKKEKRTLVKDA